MKQEIIIKLQKLELKYRERDLLADELGEIENMFEYRAKANAVSEAIEIVKGIKEEE